MSMVDHGGAVSTSDVDTEMFLEELVQCVIALTMGADEMLGDDKTINAFKVNNNGLGHTPANSLHTIDQMCHGQIAIKDFWPVPEEPFETEYLNYIHRVLEERRGEGDNDLPPSTTFPRPLFGELVLCTDPCTGRDIIDSTHLRCRGTDIKYEQHIHFCAGFSKVTVDLTWFVTRKEFFRAILATLKAATPTDAVPDFDLPDNFNQSPRKYQLRDWGLCMPLKGCKFESASYKVPDEKWSGSSVAPDGLTVQDCSHSGVTAPQDNFKKERCECLNQLPGAFNCTGTIWMMSSQLLADPHGKIIPHLEQHDLESVFWMIFWCLVKCQGPFHDIVRWFAKISQSQTTSVVFDGTDSTTMELLPPFWMRAGLYHYTFCNVLESHLQTLSNWEYYKSLIQPYWHDTVILTGMEKMFNIFMSKGIAQAKSGGGIKFNLAFNQGLGNDQLIGIIEEILAGMGNNVNYLYMTSQLMVDVKNNGWQCYEALLRHSQLPPVHDPNDNLTNNPTTTIPPKCHCPLPSIDSSDVSYSAPSLQGSESAYSVISSCGQQQLYSSFTTGHHDKWAGLTMAAAKDMLKRQVQELRITGSQRWMSIFLLQQWKKELKLTEEFQCSIPVNCLVLVAMVKGVLTGFCETGTDKVPDLSADKCRSNFNSL
ncbi:hypothetical protein BD769DRAFT_1668127 [Suillus cothurnatus]|nr:hypothetical protein BD769DRAFT_1668127 [Suillus cothurnatus]